MCEVEASLKLTHTRPLANICDSSIQGMQLPPTSART